MRNDLDPATVIGTILTFCLASCLGAVALVFGWPMIGEAIISTGQFLHGILA